MAHNVKGKENHKAGANITCDLQCSTADIL